MFEGWFPSEEELDAYQLRRREEREVRVDTLMSELTVQLHITTQRPLAELASPSGTRGSTDPRSVMDALLNLD